MKTVILTALFIVGCSQPAAVVTEPPAPTASPTPAPVEILTGRASWYRASYCKRHPCIPYYVAAGPRLRELVPVRYHMEPVAIQVTSVKTGKSLIAYVVDWCTCTSGTPDDPSDDKVADFAPEIFDALGIPRSRGVMRVEIVVLP